MLDELLGRRVALGTRSPGRCRARDCDAVGNLTSEARTVTVTRPGRCEEFGPDAPSSPSAVPAGTRRQNSEPRWARAVPGRGLAGAGPQDASAAGCCDAAGGLDEADETPRARPQRPGIPVKQALARGANVRRRARGIAPRVQFGSLAVVEQVLDAGCQVLPAGDEPGAGDRWNPWWRHPTGRPARPRSGGGDRPGPLPREAPRPQAVLTGDGLFGWRPGG
ncbi:hypothetical protein HBB16_20535 [Pseudonocardia sp. MCCB 268]|nr:hypothetical protein [Pseudonocardia cytotoxica]